MRAKEVDAIANVPTYGNQFQGLGCALFTNRGTKAVTGVDSLAPFLLIEHTLVSYETMLHVTLLLDLADLFSSSALLRSTKFSTLDLREPH